MSTQLRRVLLLGMAAACSACARGEARHQDTVLLFVAASLTNAVKPQLDSFTARTGTTVLTESGGSMEHVRKITDLHRVPDVVWLVDDDLFGKRLAPNYVTWWVNVGKNQLVVAYTDKSRGHDSITADNWYRILTTKGVEVGRSDPTIAPVGARALVLFALAQLAYKQKGLAEKLVTNAPPKNMRANAADLAALLAAGELDYIYDYESVAQANHFRYLSLPTVVTGLPVTYALSIPIQAHNPGGAASLLEYLNSDSVRARLRAAHIDLFDQPTVNGTGAPAFYMKAGR